MRQLFLLLLFFCDSAIAGPVDPDIEWKVLRTAHFEIIFDKRQKELALQYAKFAEFAHSSLLQSFSELPELTTVVISDSTDLANGYASFLPYPSITVFPVLPNAMDSISDYENWALELMVHEYTHILTFQPSHGFYTPFKYIFGTLVRPTAILPKWWLEGVAVEMESRYTLRGRLRASGTSATLRALSLDKKLREETVDRINEQSISTYPFGQRPYLFGSLLLHEMNSRTKNKASDQILQRHSRRLPFLLNAPVEDLLGKDYATLLLEIYSDIDNKTTAQKELVSAGGIEALKPIQHSGTAQVSPAISPDGRYLSYIAYEPYGGAEVRLVERDPNQKESFAGRPFRVLKRGKSFYRVSWLPDSKAVVYDRLAVFDRRKTYRDIYQLNLVDGTETRLTEGWRAHEPTLSPNGQYLVFVQYDGDKTSLVALNLKNRQMRILFRANPGARISRPEFLDDQRLVFSGHSPQSGTEKLYLMQLNGKARKSILDEYSRAGQARFSAKGLLFSSNRTGVSNLYLADSSLKTARALSNTLTEVVNADYDPVLDQIVSSRLTGEGRKLFFSSAEVSYVPPQLSPVNRQDFSLQSRTKPIPDTPVEEREFYPIKYLLPRYWIPFIYPVEGGVILQGATANSDPVGINSYLLEGSIDTVTDKASYGIAYTNSSFEADLNLAYSEYNEYLGASDDTLTSRTARAGTDFFLPGLSHHWSGSLFGVLTETELTSGVLKRHGPSLGFNYTNFDRDESEYQGGWSFGINHTEYSSDTQSLNYGRTYLNLSGKLSQPLPARHSLSAQLKAVNAPNLPIGGVVVFGEKTQGANYFVSLLNSTLLMRGYPSAAFAGRQLANVNLAYNFPVTDLYKGSGTKPVFLQGISGAVFIDAIALDGAYYDIESKGYSLTELSQAFYSSGAEFSLATTFGYHLPLQITLGLYYGFDEKAGGGFTTFLGLGYSGIQGLNHQAQLRRATHP